MKNLLIRRMTDADIEAVARLEKECFSTPWSEKSLRESTAREEYTFLVAMCDGVVAGYAGMVRTLDEADITDVAVFKEFRRLGAGKQLMETMAEQAKSQGVAVIYLEVRKSNTPAIKLYRSCGYKENGIRRNFYENPTEDALLFAAQIV